MTGRIVLAFDCAGRELSVALGRGGEVLAARRERRLRGHGERLFGLIQEVLSEAGLNYADLDMIAVTRGPGSFTGLRIGLAAARGLALAGGQPVFAATTFELAMASVPVAQAEGRHIVALVDSKRRDLFVQIATLGRDKRGSEPIGDPFAAEPAQLDDLLPAGRLLLCGDGAAAAVDSLQAAGRSVLVPAEAAGLDARWLLSLADGADREKLPPVRPLYLRPPDVTLPTPSGSTTRGSEPLGPKMSETTGANEDGPGDAV
ncbi:tRNA (adenosine(37)-N6)-threonylcarbamoyltransferase complex dimerization subunit type 1 TsaB [Algihabitans sp.]|uniref:tRNA (adenosine(37)-N6)-threonylcarbamoyltransferase complex dimerization subunit type 1 TsaB n=1 Tax=Algihabitans sp. TaxID=2821514 RepID=UPI003BABFB7C